MADLESNQRLEMSEISEMSEDASLLQDEEAPCRRVAEEGACKRCATGRCRERWIIFASGVIFLLSIILVCTTLRNMAIPRDASRRLPDSVYSPARAAEGFQAVTFDGAVNTTSPWKGPPSDQLDQAWKDLYHVGPFPIASIELQRIGKTSMGIPSRPGFSLAKLAVFHQIHCLDQIRRFVHDDYYHVDDKHSWVSTRDHVDHCIDIIRQVLICKADTTLITFHKKEAFGTDPDFGPTHACANFAQVHDWATTREINMTQERIDHPEAFHRSILKDLNDKLDEAKAHKGHGGHDGDA